MRSYSDLLRGVRVVELCWAWAGPLAGRMFGDLGAEVIKVEGPSRPDAVRFGNYPNDDPGTNPWDRGGHFQKHSRSKKSLVVDLTDERGRDAFLTLIAKSDVFIENNSPRVLENLNISYEVLREVNPRLVMTSMPGFGATGPLRNWIAFGLNLEATCGLSTVTGYRDTGPVRSVVPYGDPIAGLHGVVATMAALRRSRGTGRGSHIEVAQNESLINVLIEPLFKHLSGVLEPAPDGCHHDFFAPHNAYATSGDDDWVCITVEDTVQFHALADVVGQPAWRDDPELDHSSGRKHREKELDEAISAWASEVGRDEAVDALAAAGVPVAPALRVRELVDDPMLKRRGYWTTTDHPVTGRLPYAYLPWHFRRSEPSEIAPAPLFGQHNTEILRDIVGLNDAEIAGLIEAGVVTDTPNMA